MDAFRPPGRLGRPVRKPESDESGADAGGRYWDRTSDLFGVKPALIMLACGVTCADRSPMSA